MNHVRAHRVAAAGAMILALGAAPALAQSVTASGTAGLGGQGAGVTGNDSHRTVQTTRNHNQAPVFHLFGAPVVIASPVAAPYSSADEFSTYEGQPGGGPNAILAASTGGTP